MYSQQFTYVCVILMGLISFSLEDCQGLDRYEYKCGRRRNYDNSCEYFTNTYSYTLHCFNLVGLNKVYLLNSWRDRYLVEIFDSNLDEIAPGTFQGLGKLENLTIYNSNVLDLNPGAFNGLHLFYLNLSHNSITTISKGIFNSMYTLDILDLSQNAIEVIDKESFTGMDNLLNFYLNDNRISDMSPLTNCAKLTILDISNNTISKLDFLVDCFNIEVLNVSGNNIEYLDKAALYTLQNMKSLDLSKNMIKFIDNETFAEMKNLKELYLNGNQISDIPLLDNCIKLMILDVSSNKINNLNVLENLANLKQINLSRNSLFNETDMPVDLFRNVLLLETLNLSHTSIQKLKFGSFSNLEKLETLDLSSNNLAYLPQGIFHDLTSLRYLYINDNQLSHFEYDGFSQLHEINLNDNIWNCITLSVLIKNLDRNRIIRGTAYNTTNVYGISCYEETKDFQNLPEYNTSNLNILDKEYLSYIIKTQNEVSKTLKELITSLNQAIPSRNDQVVSKLVETLQSFVNTTNSNQKNYSETYWKTMEKSLQNSRYNIEEIIEKIGNTIALTQNKTEKTEIIEKIGNTIALTQNKTENDMQQILLNLQTALIQEGLTQRNYSIDHWNKQYSFQKNIHESLMDIKNILSSSKTVSQPLMADEKYATNAEKLKIQENNSLGQDVTIPFYCVFVVLSAIFILLLLKQFKKIKRSRSHSIECNSLSTLQV